MTTTARTLLKTFTLAALSALTLSTVSPSARADTTKAITLDGQTLVHDFDLAGSVSRTLYRNEDYQTTCTRQVPVTVYRYECDTRTVRHCRMEPGYERCTSHPVCRDVDRPVCNSHGCTSHTTRECTSEESCSTTPPHEYCTSEQEQYNCGDRPYTEYRDETYSCTQTRAVPIGTELVEDLTSHVTVQFTGNLQGISGKDTFLVSIGNGVDVAGEVSIALTHSEDTHFLKLKRLVYEKTSVGSKKSAIKVVYQIEALPLSDALGMKTTITDLDADRGGLRLDVAGAKLDENVKIVLNAKKDRRLGGMTEAGLDTFYGNKVKTEVITGGQRALLPFGECFNRRPYEFDVTLTRSVSKLITDGLMNPGAIEKVSGTLVSKFSKRIRLSGPKHPQCDAK